MRILHDVRFAIVIILSTSTVQVFVNPKFKFAIWIGNNIWLMKITILTLFPNLALNKLTNFLDLSTCEGENFCQSSTEPIYNYLGAAIPIYFNYRHTFLPTTIIMSVQLIYLATC
jgi:hypothetical protein